MIKKDPKLDLNQSIGEQLMESTSFITKKHQTMNFTSTEQDDKKVFSQKLQFSLNYKRNLSSTQYIELMQKNQIIRFQKDKQIFHQGHLKKANRRELERAFSYKDKLMGGGSSVSGCCKSDNTTTEIGNTFAYKNKRDVQKQGGNISDKDVILRQDQLDEERWIELKKKIDEIPKTQSIAKKKQKEFTLVYNTFVDVDDVQSVLESKSEFQIEIRHIIEKCFYDYREVLHLLDRTQMYDLCNLVLLYIFSDIESINNQINDMQDNQEEIDKLTNLLKEINKMIAKYQLSHPCLDLKLITQFLITLNSYREGFDEKQRPLYQKLLKITLDVVKVASCLNNTIDFVENINIDQITSTMDSAKEVFKQFMELFQEVNEKNQIVQKYGDEYQTNNLFIQLNIIWIKKMKRFQQQIKSKKILIDEELEFYISALNEITLDGSQEIINYLLLQIRYLLDKGKSELQTLLKGNGKQKIRQTIIDFAKMLLINKEESFFQQLYNQIIQLYIDPSYRFLIIYILLQLVEIEGLFTNKAEREHILKVLSIRYLQEKQDSVRIIFMYSKPISDFVHSLSSADFNKKEEIVEEQKLMTQQLAKYIDKSTINEIQESIDNIEDVDKMISESLIKKWEQQVRMRQSNNLLAHKDDVLLDLMQLYVNQSLTFESGNNIFIANVDQVEVKRVSQVEKEQELLNNSKQIKNQIQSQQILIHNALDQVITQFIIQNYKYPIKDTSNSNKKDQGNGCKILTILAEGGTGKSMFFKKLETELINRTGLAADEKANYIPLMIKCNSLDLKKPSIEEFLKQQKLTQEQIDNLKKSERNKLIMLDGYDEYAGDYFSVYETLNLNSWKNTLVIVSSRLEKISISDAEKYFCYLSANDEQDNESNFSITKLQQFEKNDIKEYFEKFKNEEIIKQGEKFNKQEYEVMEGKCLKNQNLLNLLKLPINLYFITRMIADVNEYDISFKEILEHATDQIEIQEYFFRQQFSRHSSEFIANLNIKFDQNQNHQLQNYVINSFFEYFQAIAMTMFLKKGIASNFLQIDKKIFQETQFKLREQKGLLSQEQILKLKQCLNAYVDSKVITRIKLKADEDSQDIQQEGEMDNENIIEFRHKSIFEYFCARSMKYDFDIHKENIWNMKIEELEQFNINKKMIMNAGQNQSEQQILLKLYQLILIDKNNSDYTNNYLQTNIQENNRYFQYLRRSTIVRQTDLSKIDKGASNLLSALFLSNFSFAQLEFNRCSFSQSYVIKRNNYIEFNECNLSQSFLKDMFPYSIETSNTNQATFDSIQQVYDTNNTFSFNSTVFLNETLFSINDNGYINSFKLIKDKFTLQRSYKISNSPLKTISIDYDNHILISTSQSIFIIDPNSFDIMYTHKFNVDILNISISHRLKLYFILFSNNKNKAFYGSQKIGFFPLNVTGSSSCFSPVSNHLITIQKQQLLIYQIKYEKEYILDSCLIKTIDAHKNVICALAFSPDGKYLASCSEDRTCNIWNIQDDYELIGSIRQHKQLISIINFSSDGKYLATGSQDLTCRIWNAQDGFKSIKTLEGHLNAILSVSFSTNNQYLATSSKDKSCRIWDTQNNFELINSIQCHLSSIESVAFSENGKFLATGSSDFTCNIWNCQNGIEHIRTLTGHSDEINSVAFSPNGQYLATGSSDQTCKVWNAGSSFELVLTIEEHSNQVRSVVFSPQGKYLVTCSQDKTCRIWNTLQNFELSFTIQGHKNSLQPVAFSPDGKYLATGSLDCTYSIWNAQQNFELIHTLEGHEGDVYSIAFSPDGNYLATGSQDMTCKIWSTQKKFKLLKTIEGHFNSINSVAFSQDGKCLATSSWDKTCKLWNTQKGYELINTIKTNEITISSVAFSPDGKYLAAGIGGSCKVWNMLKGFELIRGKSEQTQTYQAVLFTFDKKYLITASSDKTCRIWDTQKDFQLINILVSHTGWVSSIALSSDRKYLATGSHDKTFKIWNAQNAFELLYTIEAHNKEIKAVAFSPNGKHLATGSYDKTCKIWNTDQGFELAYTLKGHTGHVYSLSYSPDGKSIVTGCIDTICKVWNVENGYELTHTITENELKIQSVAFSPDRRYLATGYKIWDAQKDFELVNSDLGNQKMINSVTFSSDGKYIAMSSQDKSCLIYDLLKGFQLIATIKGDKQIYCNAFSPEGEYLATCSEDMICRIWNLKKGFELINTIKNHKNTISLAAVIEKKLILQDENDKKIYQILDKQGKISLQEINDEKQLYSEYIFTKLEDNNLFTCEFIL